MNFKFIKKCSIFIICIYILFSIGYCVCANEAASSMIKGTFKGDTTNVVDAKTAATNIVGSILAVTRTVAAAIALVILIVIACKYIIASAGDRADIKKYAINYIIGAVILFAASGILSIIKSAVDDSLGNP